MPSAAETARTAALAGAEVIRSMASNVQGIRSKGLATDFVSEVDIAAGMAVARAVMQADPGAGIVVEEGEVHEQLGVAPADMDSGERVWIVDPLDGTTSFLHGFPCYSVAVALIEGGTVQAGAVYNLPLDQMNWAAAGEGAYRNGERLVCSTASSIPEALLVTGFPYDRTAPLDRQLDVLAAFLRARVQGIRRDGSAAIDCCHVASGQADGFWEYNLMPWDMSAGALACMEAGATVTGVNGEHWTPTCGSILVANPTLHAELLDFIVSVK